MPYYPNGRDRDQEKIKIKTDQDRLSGKVYRDDFCLRQYDWSDQVDMCSKSQLFVAVDQVMGDYQA